MSSKPKPNPYYQGPATDHFDGTTFSNPSGMLVRSLWEVLRWQASGRMDKTKRPPWPREWPSPFPPARPEPRLEGERLRLTMVGHSSLLIQTAGLNILTDPVWSKRVSPFSFAGPARVNQPGIAFENLPKIDAVLLSHNHYDHLDGATLARLAQAHDPLVITPLGNDAVVRRTAPGMRFATGDWGDAIALGHITVHVEPARHWSTRGTTDRNMALWSAFALDLPGGALYYAGDTGFDDGSHFSAAARKHGGFRLAILPIGAYEPRWFMQQQHQDPGEAVEAFKLLDTRFAAGCHWGTFRLTDEAVDAPREDLFKALDRAGIARERFRPMQPGEVWDVAETDDGR